MKLHLFQIKKLHLLAVPVAHSDVFLGCFLTSKKCNAEKFYCFIHLEFIPLKINNCMENIVKVLSVVSEHNLNSKHNA